MRHFANFVLVFACSLTLSSCASHGPTGTHRTQMERDALVTVISIDIPHRLVTVRDAAGESLTVYVDESNKNFPQARVGDQVRIRYVESVALRLTSKAPSGVQVTESTDRPTKGRASGKSATEVTAVVRIEAVRPDGSMVTFTGPRGRRTLAVQDAAMRDYVRQLKPGDNVEATYEEALALSLEKTSH